MQPGLTANGLSMVPMLNAAGQSVMGAATQAPSRPPLPAGDGTPNGTPPQTFDKVLNGAKGDQASSAAPLTSRASGSRVSQTPTSRSAVHHDALMVELAVASAAIPIAVQTQIGNAPQNGRQAPQDAKNAESGGTAAVSGGEAGDLLARSAPLTALPNGVAAQSALTAAPEVAASDAKQQNAAVESDSLPPDGLSSQVPDTQSLPVAPGTPTGAGSKTVVDSRSPAATAIAQPNSNIEAESLAGGISAQPGERPQQVRDSEDKGSGGRSTAVAEGGGPDVRWLPVQAPVETQGLSAGPATSSRGTVQPAASETSRQVAATTQAFGASHGGGDTPGKDTNSSNSDSAAAQTAGLAQTAVGGPLHAPAVANASLEASAGPAAASVSAQPPAAQAAPTAAMAARPAPLPAPAPSSPNDFLQASQLYQRVGGAEMHVAMNTEMLGPVDVHAVVRQSTVTATIGVQRPEVQTLLANDLPALQHALSEHSLHVEQISVLGGSTGGQTDSSRHTPQNQQEWRASAGGFTTATAGSESFGNSGDEMAAAATSQAAVAAGRLSVHV